MNDDMNNNKDTGNYNDTVNDGPTISKQEIAEIKKMERTSQLRKSKLITGVASAVLGLVLLFWPGLTMEIICQIIGGALCITGLLTASVYFTQPKDTPMRGASLAGGIPLALLGLFIFLRPAFLIEFIPIVIGVIILISGAIDLSESISLMKHGYGKWWLTLIVAIVTMLLGFILITRPFGIARAIMRVIGAVILYNGVSDIFIASRIKATIKDV